jgi:hypothetical protein
MKRPWTDLQDSGEPFSCLIFNLITIHFIKWGVGSEASNWGP